ncbi:hypothetical protein MnTg03_01414 [bacterium MnTg03]|nr:hypothetical protein MnTg03_01414 [bacterium MnTg03]
MGALNLFGIWIGKHNRAILFYRLVHGIADFPHQVGSIIKTGAVRKCYHMTMVMSKFRKYDPLAVKFPG